MQSFATTACKINSKRRRSMWHSQDSFLDVTGINVEIEKGDIYYWETIGCRCSNKNKWSWHHQSDPTIYNFFEWDKNLTRTSASVVLGKILSIWSHDHSTSSNGTRTWKGLCVVLGKIIARVDAGPSYSSHLVIISTHTIVIVNIQQSGCNSSETHQKRHSQPWTNHSALLNQSAPKKPSLARLRLADASLLPPSMTGTSSCHSSFQTAVQSLVRLTRKSLKLMTIQHISAADRHRISLSRIGPTLKCLQEKYWLRTFQICPFIFLLVLTKHHLSIHHRWQYQGQVRIPTSFDPSSAVQVPLLMWNADTLPWMQGVLEQYSIVKQYWMHKWSCWHQRCIYGSFVGMVDM